MGVRALNVLFERIDVVCQTSGTYLAIIRPGRSGEVLEKLKSRARVRLKLGSALVKYEYGGASITYVAPNRLIVRLRDSGTLEEVKALLLKLVG
ncbi:MAG: hypothetical protein DRJ96_00970 [Thermoprotei archaeon]|nr:hypothetical protein [Thermoproteales archaeon]RLE89003.1 MAG: hypothetical protein DRJ67_00535 [Thermoprotei archaeon]RLE98515.1 MAG: hypothetical protein DRJ96_00970 [Thermoprotei archaeon]